VIGGGTLRHAAASDKRNRAGGAMAYRRRDGAERAAARQRRDAGAVAATPASFYLHAP
jgi:hypothetical protein